MLVSVVCCVGSGLCDELITRSDESYRLCVSNCGRFRNCNNEAALAQIGLLCHRKKYRMYSKTERWMVMYPAVLTLAVNHLHV
jgi:hypothetical protein